MNHGLISRLARARNSAGIGPNSPSPRPAPPRGDGGLPRAQFLVECCLSALGGKPPFP